MDLQISVFLLFILFTAGHSLKCSSCKSGTCGETVCTTETNCFSSVTVGPIDPPVIIKKCAAATECSLESYNINSYKSSSYCCEKDLCNVLDPSDAPNGKKCYYCDDKDCSKELSCSGIQDRCGTSTRTVDGQKVTVKGCVSKSLCDTTPATLGIAKVECCEGNLCNGPPSSTGCVGNLCNGAQSVTQSFLFLCCSLLSYFMMH